MKSKKIALVTGATGAIGKAISRQLVATGNYRVFMVVKDEIKALNVMEDIRRHTRCADIRYVVTDLSSKKKIFELASGIQDPVNVLINNAADTPRKRTETEQGLEVQLATNVLGYFWMTEAFTPHLKAGAPSRVVNVSSYWAGGLDLTDMEFKRRQYDNDAAYRQSKQADRMLTCCLCRQA